MVNCKNQKCMRKFYYVFAALATVVAASCAKLDLNPEEMPSPMNTDGFVTISVNLPSDISRTSLGADGKSVTWAKGDSILVTDGTAKYAALIPDSAEGQSSTEIFIDPTKLDCSGTLYAVYPFDAFKSVTNGAINVTIPNEQSGLFEQANICVAKADDYVFNFKNATAIMKVTVTQPDIETLMLSGGAADTLASTLAVTYAGKDEPLAVKAASPLKSIKVTLGGLDGDYYVAVTPATYSTDFSMMVVTLDGKSEKVVSTKAHTLAANDIVSLGNIGDNLQGISLDGTGAEDDPFLITNLAELTTVATCVNNGITYEGQYFKLADDISDVDTPVGKYDQVPYYFQGIFDGNGKTLTLAMGGDECEDSYLGVFGCLGPGAEVSNLKVAGTVKTVGDNVAGVAAYASGSTQGVKITGCAADAAIEGASYVAGIVGACDGLVEVTNCTNSADIIGAVDIAGGIVGQTNGAKITIQGCVNEGDITAPYNIGGICGYSYASVITGCQNKGAVSGTGADFGGIYKMNQGASGFMWHNWSGAWAGGTPYNLNNSIRGVGGIAGYAQNASVKNNTNSGAITGPDKVGGIIGACYGATTAGNTNNGAVTADNTLAGGIAGWVYTVTSADGDINNGPVTAKFAVGGLYGMINACGYSSSNATSNIKNGTNNGAVVSTEPFRFVNAAIHTDYSGAGGIVGYICGLSRATGTRGLVSISGCNNTADVTGPGWGVGGVVGVFQTQQFSLTHNLSACSNTGDVTGLCCVGGIIGDLWMLKGGHAKITMANLSNTGAVASTISGEVNAYVGGLFGRAFPVSTVTNLNYGPQLTNCFNTGDVTYAAETAAPYAGGIAGYFNQGAFTNIYNTGYVGPASGEPVEGATGTIGGVCGYVGSNAPTNYAYFDEGTASLAFGTSSVAASIGEYVSDVNPEGGLYSIVKIKDVEYDEIYPALNAWVAANSGYQWAEGPVFVK